jgi:plastocyanin
VRAPAAILSTCAAIALGGAAMALGGCSDDQKPVRTVKVAPNATLQMAAHEYRFDPGRIIVAAQGKTAGLEIVLHNRGTLAHNIHVRDGDRNLAATRSFRPGDQGSVSLSLPRGTYDFLCTVADHDEKGMTGKIEVR